MGFVPLATSVPRPPVVEQRSCLHYMAEAACGGIRCVFQTPQIHVQTLVLQKVTVLADNVFEEIPSLEFSIWVLFAHSDLSVTSSEHVQQCNRLLSKSRMIWKRKFSVHGHLPMTTATQHPSSYERPSIQVLTRHKLTKSHGGGKNGIVGPELEEHSEFEAFESRGRVVKAMDLKSIGGSPRRFESCRLRSCIFLADFICELDPYTTEQMLQFNLWRSETRKRKENPTNHEGIRTLNLLIRSQTPYPLGHVVTTLNDSHKIEEVKQTLG
ncbi:hypothetical protein STEG23_012768 [Scotinomys teguina]